MYYLICTLSVTNSTARCYSRCRHVHLGSAQLTLLTVTEVTVVPAVWLMVLGVTPEAPPELWKDKHRRHNFFLRLLGEFSKLTFQVITEEAWI